MTFDFARPPVFFNHKDGMMEVQYLPDYNGKIAETEYLATQNSGRTWRVIASKSYNVRQGGGFGDILNAKHVYLAAEGTVYTLENSQKSWHKCNVHFAITPNYVDFVSPLVGWTYNLNGTMFRSQNGGDTWIELHPTEVVR